MTRSSFRLGGVLLGCALSVLAAPVIARAYPDHVIRLIVPYPPGGDNDALGRLVAQRLSSRLGQQCSMGKRPGWD